MENAPIKDLIEVTMSKLKEMVDVNTVIGDSITTPDGITIIPVSKVSFAFASGGSEFNTNEKPGFGYGNGAGVKVDPIGFLVIKDSNVRMVSIAPPVGTTVDRLIELIPDIFDRVDAIIDKQKSRDE